MPFTLAVLLTFLLTAALTGSFLGGPPESMLDVAGVSGPGLRSGEWWSLFTSLFFANNPLAYLTASLMIFLLVGVAERKLGTVPAALYFFGGQFASVTLFLLLTQLARYSGDGWLGLMAESRLIGPYAAVLTVSWLQVAGFRSCGSAGSGPPCCLCHSSWSSTSDMQKL